MLELHGLTRRFGDLTAVDDVSFEVADGLLTGFVGGNGAGKTTTMRMAMGLLARQAGEIRWQGRPSEVTDQRRFGYMPEERGLYPKQRVIDQLVYLGELHGLTASAARAGATDYLERLGLADRAKDRVEKLSLGNQQKVQIVAALLGEPTALILDEPFSGLDPDAVDTMTGLLREHSSRGIPVLFSSHQLDLVERLCDRLVIMARGRVVARGTVAELRSGGPTRYRLDLAGDAGWVRDFHRGIHPVDVDGGRAVVEVEQAGAEQALLSEAVRRGPVHEFARLIPALSEIYREVTA
jgi:ABC-2 type transport system ATP-binding protein